MVGWTDRWWDGQTDDGKDGWMDAQAAVEERPAISTLLAAMWGRRSLRDRLGHARKCDFQGKESSGMFSNGPVASGHQY